MSTVPPSTPPPGGTYTPPPPPPPPAGGGTSVPNGNYALWADRAIAALIDLGITIAAIVAVWILLTIVGMIFGGIGGVLGSSRYGSGLGAVSTSFGCLSCLVAMLMPTIVYLVVGIYNKVILVSKRGYSIGQGFSKFKILTANGSLVPIQTLVIRLLITALFMIIPFIGPLFGLLDLLWPLWDPQRQTLHDKAVGTFAIKDESMPGGFTYK